MRVKSLYSLALAEGEGVGTAYEYMAKRLLLFTWLEKVREVSRILIAGLPEKYGSSLDFLLLAHDLGAAVTVFEDRHQALEKLANSINAAVNLGWFNDLAINTTHVSDLSKLPVDLRQFDLCLSSEVLQRLAPTSRLSYIEGIRNCSGSVALFAPNADNPAHTEISGLSGIHLSEFKPLFGDGYLQAGYIDMPPFPPGITRSEDQRARASEGRLESLVMSGLDLFVRIERLAPMAVKKRQSHIVYAYAST